jgi:hypothetical protein
MRSIAYHMDENGKALEDMGDMAEGRLRVLTGTVFHEAAEMLALDSFYGAIEKRMQKLEQMIRAAGPTKGDSWSGRCPHCSYYGNGMVYKECGRDDCQWVNPTKGGPKWDTSVPLEGK